MKAETAISVERSQEDAFRLFTEDMGAWWPLSTHSIGEDRAKSVRVEPRVGGRIVETDVDGTEHVWATILAWDPPNLMRVRWGVNPEKPETEWEVRFEAHGPSTTRVELVHWGWEVFGEDAAEEHAGYSEGWKVVLGKYAEAADARPA